jgi:hypothetical protein
MSDLLSKKIGNKEYQARVEQETDTTSPVVVMGNKYTVTFDGNDFQNKHLRRIRRNSVSLLKSPVDGPGKLAGYTTEAKDKAVNRWNGNAASTNSLVFLDLAEFCQFGAQIIQFLKTDRAAWTPYGHQNVMQKHVAVTLDKCLAYTNSGTGETRAAQEDGKVQGGVGMVLNVVVRQVGGKATNISVCHYDAAGSAVQSTFKDAYLDKSKDSARGQIAGKIVN